MCCVKHYDLQELATPVSPDEERAIDAWTDRPDLVTNGMMDVLVLDPMLSGTVGDLDHA